MLLKRQLDRCLIGFVHHIVDFDYLYLTKFKLNCNIDLFYSSANMCSS